MVMGEFKRMVLGKSGIEVTELCFGALPIGPLQKNVGVETAAEVIGEALTRGVNFVDTAESYGTYPHIKKAMDKTGIRPVISTKSSAVTYADMEKAVREALDVFDVKTVDIFLLHAARVKPDVFDIRKEAFKCLLDYRENGKIKAVGIATHDVTVTRAAADNPEIDIVFPLINKTGMGVLGGSLKDMEEAVNYALDAGKGVFLMKALAGGNLIDDYAGAVEYARNVTGGRAPLAVGMVDKRELEWNIRYFTGAGVAGLHKIEQKTKEFIILKGLCKACGRCVEACHSVAVDLNAGYAAIDSKSCIKCGYCVAACPEFGIRMI